MGKAEAIQAEDVAMSETKAHLILRRCNCVRRDGSPVEEACTFYRLDKDGHGWPSRT
jgi:hypothetical protein